MKMRSRQQHPVNTKNIAIGIIIVFFLLLVFRSTFSSSNGKVSYTIPQTITPKAVSDSFRNIQNVAKCSPTCTKIPPSFAQALVHYSTSTITPQQTIQEISITKNILDQKSPCNFLIFGLGHDSLMWSALNFNGRTVFLEEDEAWIAQIKKRFPMLESYHVTYDSKVHQADSLMEAGKGQECTMVGDTRHSACQLALKGLPSDVYETTWDLIMVDAPTGYYDEAPGRMSAIYTAGMIARNREEGETDVFVHDVNRVVEDKFSNAFLCEGYMVKQEGRLRHFRIPSHKDDPNKSFCP